MNNNYFLTDEDIVRTFTKDKNPKYNSEFLISNDINQETDIGCVTEQEVQQYFEYVDQYNKFVESRSFNIFRKTIVVYLLEKHKPELIKFVPPKYYGHKLQHYWNGETTMMIALKLGYLRYLPKQLYHDGSVEDSQKNTLCHVAARTGYLHHVPKKLYCGPVQANMFGLTVVMVYVYNYYQISISRPGYKFEIPEEFYHAGTLGNKQGNTVAMIAARHNCLHLIPRVFYHSATLRNQDGFTVAMIAAASNNLKDLPEEFEHSSTLKTINGQTLAMIFAVENPDKINELPERYIHDKYLKDVYNDTVKDLLCRAQRTKMFQLDKCPIYQIQNTVNKISKMNIIYNIPPQWDYPEKNGSKFQEPE